MADISKLKSKRNALGGAVPPSVGSNNLQSPELAPEPPNTDIAPVLDGRSLRSTGRTVQFATRVTPEFKARVMAYANKEGIKMVEVLERALDALEDKT